MLRSQKAISRRANRLKLTFYKVKNDDVLLKFSECLKAFIGYGKRADKQKYCKNCLKIYHARYMQQWRRKKEKNL